jgi:uncharacterized protein YtpQ (UPF0354 family)
VSKLAENNHDASAIVPLIKRFVAEGAGDPPPVTIPESYTPVVEELTPCLGVAYVFDLPDRFEYVTPFYCTRLELGTQDLRPLAVRNLTQRRDKPQITWRGGAGLFTLDGNLEASLLLADHVWWQIAPHVAGDLVAVAPSRTTLAVTGTDNAMGMKTLGLYVDHVWREAETRTLLTKSFYIRRGDSWEQFNPAADRGDGTT